MNKKSGFTLAEVLVTLMIIGVIAAMTVPSLMQTTSQQEYKSALKKGLSTLNQAITMHYALEGETVADQQESLVTGLFAKRLNVTEYTGETSFYTADGLNYKIVNTDGDCSYDPTDPASQTMCVEIQVDVNGKKGPNTITTDKDKLKDIYTFHIYPQKVLPIGTSAEVVYMK